MAISKTGTLAIQGPTKTVILKKSTHGGFQMSTIKVQIIGGVSTRSVIENRQAIEVEFRNQNPLTFHAYSDEMKARILEQMLKSPAKIGISFTDEEPRTGEWHEPLIVDAVFNS